MSRNRPAHLKALLEDGSEFRALRVLAVKFFGGLSGIGAGLALGREGPTVQVEGAICASSLSVCFRHALSSCCFLLTRDVKYMRIKFFAVEG
ncbi:MAG TPA: hypothetical protein DCG57_09425 [Candidatus Riflebacteria bacterium]|nr:hypothetical protein [Candidatus Riflebacteria bacterium]